MINLGVGASDVKTLRNARNAAKKLENFKCIMTKTGRRLEALFLYVYLRDISKSMQPLIRHDCIAEIHLFTLRTTFNIERKSLSL